MKPRPTKQRPGDEDEENDRKALPDKMGGLKSGGTTPTLIICFFFPLFFSVLGFKLLLSCVEDVG